MDHKPPVMNSEEQDNGGKPLVAAQYKMEPPPTYAESATKTGDRTEQVTPTIAPEKVHDVTPQPMIEETRVATVPSGRPAEDYVVNLHDLRHSPDFINCPWCMSRQRTVVNCRFTEVACGMSIFMCIACGVVPGILPYLCPSSYETDHRCRGCGCVVAHVDFWENSVVAVTPLSQGQSMNSLN
ncbi:hypothetical protein GGR54DRAFT_39458 [Hypoxylon sp. NC1633]|nr:hypothetical protein GGR54DRAFT_39458 [Hypoxylon sp. NC1633]